MPPDPTEARVIATLSQLRSIDRREHDGSWWHRLETYRSLEPAVAELGLDHPELLQWWMDRTGVGEPAPQVVEYLLGWAANTRRSRMHVRRRLLSIMADGERYTPPCRARAAKMLRWLLSCAACDTGDVLPAIRAFVRTVPNTYHGAASDLLSQLRTEVSVADLLGGVETGR